MFTKIKSDELSGGNIKNSSQYKVLTLTSFLMNFLHYFWATTYSPFRNDGGILRIFLRCNNNTIAHIFTSVVCVEGKIGKRFSLPFAVNLCSQYFSWLFGLALSVTSNQFFGFLIFILWGFSWYSVNIVAFWRKVDTKGKHLLFNSK